jgi:hypothetical protein
MFTDDLEAFDRVFNLEMLVILGGSDALFLFEFKIKPLSERANTNK